MPVDKSNLQQTPASAAAYQHGGLTLLRFSFRRRCRGLCRRRRLRSDCTHRNGHPAPRTLESPSSRIVGGAEFGSARRAGERERHDGSPEKKRSDDAERRSSRLGQGPPRTAWPPPLSGRGRATSLRHGELFVRVWPVWRSQDHAWLKLSTGWIWPSRYSGRVLRSPRRNRGLGTLPKLVIWRCYSSAESTSSKAFRGNVGANPYRPSA